MVYIFVEHSRVGENGALVVDAGISLSLYQHPYSCAYPRHTCIYIWKGVCTLLMILWVGITEFRMQKFHFPVYIHPHHVDVIEWARITFRTKYNKVFPLWKHVYLHIYFIAGVMNLNNETMVLWHPSSSLGLLSSASSLRLLLKKENQ